MRYREYILIFAVLVLAASCGGSAINGTSATEETADQAVMVGNPPSPLPTTPDQMTAKYLKEHPVWKGSAAGDDKSVFAIRFDIDGKKAYIISSADSSEKEISFSVLEDGSIASIEGSIYDIGGGLNRSSVKYPLLLDITSDSLPVTAVFASAENDIEYQKLALSPKEACLASKDKMFDSDADAVEEGYYHIAGSVVAKGLDGSDCGIEFVDFCDAEGKHLVEFEIEEGNVISKTVECGCNNGKCVDVPTDESKLFTKTVLDYMASHQEIAGTSGYSLPTTAGTTAVNTNTALQNPGLIP